MQPMQPMQQNLQADFEGHETSLQNATAKRSPISLLKDICTLCHLLIGQEAHIIGGEMWCSPWLKFPLALGWNIGMLVVHIIWRPFRRRTHEKVMVIDEVRRRKLFIQAAVVEL